MRQAQHGLTWSSLQSEGFDSVRAVAGCQENGGCRFEEQALYHADQVLPTHIVHFRLVRSSGGALVSQPLSTENRTLAQDLSLDELLLALSVCHDGAQAETDSRRIKACKTLGDVARDDQHKAIKKFLSDRRLVSLLGGCARSVNEALQFEALRAWFNFSFNDSATQEMTLQQLGVSLLSVLLDSPNASLRMRATGLVWNLTQHDVKSRQLFVDAGMLQKLGAALEGVAKEVVSSVTPPWGVVQLLFGALANIALTCGDNVRNHANVVQTGELFVGMDLITPPVVQQQVTRFVCNLISDGNIDPEWQEKGFTYRTSAPREMVEVA